MAVLKYGALVSEIKGKVGGFVFQKCGSQLSLRISPAHKPTRTSPASLQRLRVTRIGDMWRSLPTSVQQQFIIVASSYPVFNKFGVAFNLTGYQCFFSLAQYGLLATNEIVVNPINYSPPAINQYQLNSYSIASQFCQLSYAQLCSSTQRMVLFISNPKVASGNPDYSKVYFVTSFDNLTTSANNIYNRLRQLFRVAPISGESFTYQWVVYDFVTGQHKFDNEGICPIF